MSGADLDARALELARAAVRAPYRPSSAYRLQLNAKFTFAQAGELLDYFEELGADALYCSPYFQAAAGSPHGYDVVDPTRLNAEIGGAADYDAFCAGLRARGLGHILDVVPNHMGVSGNGNAWWQDVLESGPASAYARVFDVDWNPVKTELRDRVLLPVLGDMYGAVLEAGRLSVTLEDGRPRVAYWDHRFPVDPATYPELLGPASARVEAALAGEPALLARWRGALEALWRLPSREDRAPGRAEARRAALEPARRAFEELLRDAPVLRERLAEELAALNADRPRLHRFLESQAYRLCFWRAAADEINYRRFFDINALAAIRIEDEEVLSLHHGLLLRLVREGRLQGLRIDHPDGLYDPRAYFQRLQQRCLEALVLHGLGRDDAPAAAAAARAVALALAEPGADKAPFYVVAEKILDRKEELPKDWSVAGTVGYGFLNALNGVFVDGSKETEFDKVYREHIGHAIDYDRLVYDKKKFFAMVNMASETAALAHRLDAISERDWFSRDLTLNHLTLAIREALACFPVYRTYIAPGDEAVTDRDQRYIRAAVGKGRDRLPALHPGVFDFLERVLLLKSGSAPGSELERLYRDFVLRFQQISGPIMAKGVEDTAFYVFNRLLSLNEVGGDPTGFGLDRTGFHAYLAARRADWPHAMLETSTHDTKRSEDVRQRLNALSEIPLEWQARLAEWSELNERFKTPLAGTLEPRRNTEYFIYQTLLGVWPNEPVDAAGRAALLGRVWEAVLKSSREAKIYTDWNRPDSDYEEALRRFVEGVVTNDKFLSVFLPFHEKIAHCGMHNSLSALALKLAAPGVPDTYQGNELWDYSLVDPDNRRPVDFGLRRRRLASLKELDGAGAAEADGVRALCESWRDGRVKMRVLRQGLRLRRKERELFLEGEYRALEIEGYRQRHAIAYLRRRGDRWALAAGGRFFATLFANAADAPGESVWRGTEVVLPDDDACPARWRDELSGRELETRREGGRRTLPLPDLFSVLNAALLVGVR